ncbi:MAG: Trehalose-phosphate phosphatase [Calditrichaeota bacterium]|nr:Trehalose-phosphate phosphatase [Calditrichota bacterium]
MKWLRDGHSLDRFFSELHEAKLRVLITDYDGTLAPFVIERDRAKPYAGLSELLEEIARAERSRLIIISGRTIEDLTGIFRIESPVEIWGTHGWERLGVDGERATWPISDTHQHAIESVREWARKQGLEKHVETKHASVAVHWRGTDSRQRERLQNESATIMKRAADEGGLELHQFDGGRELRVPGRDKGVAVKQVLKDVGDGAFISYLGDDTTDEDAFNVIGERGLRVLVRNEPRETAADLWLRPPRELRRFLERWRDALAG